jgi:hypothetical protein
MSLTIFIKLPEVKAKLKPLRPKLPRKINVPLRVESRSPRYMLVGTAFDYLLRFELQRRAPHAIPGTLVADSAPECIWQPGCFLSLGMDHRQMPAQEAEMLAEKEAKRARIIVENAKKALAEYVKSEAPDRGTQADLAAHAIRLAKLDDMSRALRLDASFAEADQVNVEELLALLAIVPFNTLLHDKVLLLNPTFGDSSRLVGGADADLIAGDTLIDFKTTKSGEVTAENLDQLLGYFLLGRNEHRSDPTFPAINRLAIYFCRHGHIWPLEASVWLENPLFDQTEEWFLQPCEESVGPSGSEYYYCRWQGAVRVFG